MSVALYMDVHVRRAVTNGLRLRGVDVLTAQLSITIGQCVKDLELIAKAAEPEDFVNRVELLPL